MGFWRIGWRGVLLVLVLAVLGLLGTATVASADGTFVYHQSLRGTDTFNSEINPCNGEPFTATARFEFSTTILETPSGNDIKADLGQFSGTGVGATGARYVFSTVGLTNSDVFYAGPTQDDYFFHVTFVAIIDLETGTVSHETSHFFSDCR